MCVVDTHSLLEKLPPGLCPRVCVCEINTHNLEKLRVGLCPGVCVCVGGGCVGMGVCVGFWVSGVWVWGGVACCVWKGGVSAVY